jgi:prophage regulatory protein
MNKDTTTAPAPDAGTPDRLLRLPAVMASVGLGRTAVLDRVKAGTFPAPCKVGRATLWQESAVQAWIAARVRESRQAGG